MPVTDQTPRECGLLNRFFWRLLATRLSREDSAIPASCVSVLWPAEVDSLEEWVTALPSSVMR